MTKYGVDNANKSKEIRKKYENTYCYNDTCYTIWCII